MRSLSRILFDFQISPRPRGEENGLRTARCPCATGLSSWVQLAKGGEWSLLAPHSPVSPKEMKLIHVCPWVSMKKHLPGRTTGDMEGATRKGFAYSPYLLKHRAILSGAAEPPSLPTRNRGWQRGLACLPGRLTSGRPTPAKPPPDRGFLC